MFVETIYKQMVEANPPAAAAKPAQSRNQPKGSGK
jgi:hypothetical protein